MKKAIAFILTVAVIVLAAVGFYHYKNKMTDDKELEEYKLQTELFGDIRPKTAVGEEDDDTEQSVDYLAEGRKVNPQIVAWLTVPDSEIDFPIVRCDDNEYYLDHDFENNVSYMGAPFLDCRNSADFSDFNSVVYGHNISNKYMFYPLLNFKNKDYFDSHVCAYLTLTDKKYRINFVACAVIESDGFAYNTVFLSEKERVLFLKTAKEKAVCSIDFEPEELADKEFCTFSTCSYEFSDARTVLIGYLEEITEQEH